MIAQIWLLDPQHALPERQRLVAIVLAVGLLLLVAELLRRRRLREEYAWLWLATALALLVLAVEQQLLYWLSLLIGSATSTSTLFFGALLFLLVVSLQFSVRLSRLTQRHRILAQRLALLEDELRRRHQVTPPAAAEHAPRREAEILPLHEADIVPLRDAPVLQKPPAAAQRDGA